jgi:hypothetical protein
LGTSDDWEYCGEERCNGLPSTIAGTVEDAQEYFG